MRAGESDAEEIALGLRQRDLTVLRGLVDRLQPRLVRYLMYLLGRPEGVDDLVQETWLRVLERGRTYDGRSPFEPWLFAIARNLAMDGLRRGRTVSLEMDDEGVWAVSGEPSPFALAARSEEAAQLAEGMGRLAPIYREALLLRFVEELSLAEMAAVVGAPVSTVASRVQRGLAALRGELEERSQG